MRCKLILLLALTASACGTHQPEPILLTCANLQTGCDSQIEGQPIHIQFSSTPSTLRPFDLVLVTDAQSVEASFQMQGMEMGFNRYRLLAESSKWHARVILPACVRGRSDWMLLLDIKTAGIARRYELPFSSN